MDIDGELLVANQRIDATNRRVPSGISSSETEAEIDGLKGFASDFLKHPVPEDERSHGAFSLEVDYEDDMKRKFFNCHFQFGRAVYTISNQSATTDGTYYLCIPHSDPSSAAVSTSQGGGTTETQTVIPLVTISGGNVTADYRGMPVIPVYE